MVQVRPQPTVDDGTVDIERWLDMLSDILGEEPTNEERTRLKQACELAEQLEKASLDSDKRWAETASSFFTGLEMAQILAELQLDCNTLTSAILYRSVREGKLSLSVVEKDFGKRVAKLIDGVLHMAAIGSLQKVSENQVMGQTSAEQVDNLRKMLITIIDDVRVALLKLAERTCAIRAVKDANDDKRRRVAREVKDIYAPLAHRLGIGHIKWELEDLAFRYLEPQAYKHIARLLDEKRIDRQQFIEDVIDVLQVDLKKNHINSEISGRAKHIYSIWRKMQEKDIGFSQVYDIRAVRILVNTVHECYMVLGIVHSLWRTIPNEFDDYIARPKDNGYRSLHTAVIGPESKILEIQIRTHWMHDEAEFGVCAHWQYKGKEDEQDSPSHRLDQHEEYEEKIEWLRQVLEWHEETGGDSDLIEELRSDVVHHRIYVFTPDGHVMELPQGATTLDFAYHVHTEVGHRCRGARVNGKIVPLNYVLKTSDQVEIITGKHEVPNREWLSEGLAYTQTARAKSKIHQWFRQQAREQHIVDGSVTLDREFQRLAINDIDMDALVKQMDYAEVEDLYAAIGASDIEIADVLRATQSLAGILRMEQQGQLSFAQMPVDAVPQQDIDGIGSMELDLAPCCNPQSGDGIGGVIMENGRVAIHRLDCTQYLQLQTDAAEKILKVDWRQRRHSNYQVDIDIAAYERVGLLRDITELLDGQRVNILKLSCETDTVMNTVSMVFTVEVQGLNSLSVLLAQLNQLPNIYRAIRRR